MRKIKIFIYGSCVSRHFLSFANAEKFELVDYFARSSFASIAADPIIDNNLINRVKSKSQRSMLERDLNKSIFAAIKEKPFDVLLIDLIDERFNIAAYNNSYCTISTEFKQYQTKKYQSISFDSDVKFEMWKTGVRKFFDLTNDLGVTDRIRVSRVFWASRTDCGYEFDGDKKIYINRNNELLARMYQHIRAFISENQFINYPQRLLVAATKHKWGLQPFHYCDDFYLHTGKVLEQSQLHELKSDLVFKYAHFTPYSLIIPINWRADPFKNRNWLHHFNSLDWLLNKNDDEVVNILVDFYRFHCIQKKRNPYYNELRGDHTAAIRLGVISKLRSIFENSLNVRGVGICSRLLREEVKNLQSPGMYRSGHNHGLMVDLALLRLVKDFPEHKKNIDLNLVCERSSKTIESMWHKSGLTKEHSVSYQEYNIPITIEYFDLVEKMGLNAQVSVSLNRILEESKRFLGYALKSNGEYFPLGDSFRCPNLNILKKVYGRHHQDLDTPHHLLAPWSFENGFYANENFFIFRKNVNGRHIHFAATCCWDSNNHKQNDELSFCLDIDGVNIFDDPGYTEFLPWEDLLMLKSEKSHSTIQVLNAPWGSIIGSNKKSKISKVDVFHDGFLLEMEAERVSGFLFKRCIELKKNIFLVSDCVVSYALRSFVIVRNFILGQEVRCFRFDEKLFQISSKYKPIGKLAFESSKYTKDVVEIDSKTISVLSDRKKTSTTKSIHHVIELHGNFSQIYSKMTMEIF